GKIVPQLIQFGIGRRDHVRIESGALNFSFPLVAEKIVAGCERQRDQSQDDRDRPKQDRLFSQRDVDRKIGNCSEISNSAEKRRCDELYRHRLERPVVEEIKRPKKQKLQGQRKRQSKKAS